ncbi:MAG: sigma-70 family RNA polymerase sigma factor [Proteobacteria bacterium]|nr:MAG: sigma-70 family RNA polymerase sigma factor [Pseudomonadota bacterium]
MSSDFSHFFQKHHVLVRKVAFQIAGRRISAAGLEDLVQDSFVKIWKGLGNFRSDADVKSWIYRITVNVALDSLRSQKRQLDSVSSSDREVLDAALEGAIDERAGPEAEAVTRDLVSQGLESLSVDHRTVLILAFIHERPLSEIAEILKVPEGTVKSRLHSAKETFQNFLERKGAL